MVSFAAELGNGRERQRLSLLGRSLHQAPVDLSEAKGREMVLDRLTGQSDAPVGNIYQVAREALGFG
ncbi:hypothetical protein D3C78_1855690 [compost metagenome]